MSAKYLAALIPLCLCCCGARSSPSSDADPGTESIHNLFDLVTVPVTLSSARNVSVYVEFGSERKRIISQEVDPGICRVAVQLGASEQKLRVAIATGSGAIATTIDEPRFFNRARSSNLTGVGDPVGDHWIIKVDASSSGPEGRIILVAEEPNKAVDPTPDPPAS